MDARGHGLLLVHAGAAQAGGASSLTLAAGASATNNAYTGMVLRLVSGLGTGQQLRITAYDGASNVATVESAWGVQPDGTTGYEVRGLTARGAGT
jgi:hypothetical protein